MAVRIKVKCDEVVESGEGADKTYEVRMSAVTSGSQENKNFWKWTPSGSVVFSAVKKTDLKQGQEYYVDFTPAEGN